MTPTVSADVASRVLPRDLTALTGLRTIAACAVLGYHLVPAIAAAMPWSGWWVLPARAGSLGVDLFFALSGFVLMHVYLTVMGNRWRWRATAKFWWLRLARIYPVYLATLLVAGAYLALQSRWGNTESTDTDLFTWSRFMRQLFFIPEGPREFNTWNVPAWSILAEAIAYLAFPILVLLLGWLHRRRLPWWLLVGAALACYAALVTAALGWGPEFGLGGYQPLLRIATEFPAGALLYLAVVGLRAQTSDLQRLGRATTALSVALAVGVATGILLLQLNFGSEPWLRPSRPISFNPPQHVQALAPLLGLLIASLAAGAGVTRRGWLSRRPMVAAGRASYSEYMWHVLVITAITVVGNRLFGEETEAGAWLIVLIAPWLVWVVGFVSYRRFEAPARNRMRDMISRSA